MKKRALISIVVPLALACSAGSLAVAAPAGARPHATAPTLVEGPIFDQPGTYTYVVPAGVTHIVASVEGSYGGNGGTGTTVTVGGPGDTVQPDFTVTPGATLNIVVAAPGHDGCRTACSDPNAGLGGAGFGKGGDGSNGGSIIGGGGGGSSSLAVNGAAPIAVAAGGGGGGATTDYQKGSNPAGANDGGNGDGGSGDIQSGSGGGGGGMPGGLGGSSGTGGFVGTDVGPYRGSNCVTNGNACTNMAGRVQIGYYEPGFVVNDDEYTVKMNTTLDVPAPGVLKNDTSYGVAPKVYRGAAHGAVVLAADGGFTYKPAAGFTGYDTFAYVLENTHSSNIGQVTILVGKVAAGALTAIGTPGQGRVLLSLACGPSAACPFDIALIKKVGGSNRRIAHGTSTYLPKRSSVFAFTLPKSTRVTYGTGKNHVVKATLYITLHRKGQKVIVIASRPIVIK